MKSTPRNLVNCLPLIFLVGGYFSSYYYMSVPEQWTYSVHAIDGSTYHCMMPEYRIAHPAVHAVYAPLQWLDSKIRPSYWLWAEVPEDVLTGGFSPTRSGFGGSGGGGGFGGGGGGFGGSDNPTPVKYIQVDPMTRQPLTVQWDR